MFIHFFCLCPLSLTIKLNFNISKVAYYVGMCTDRDARGRKKGQIYMWPQHYPLCYFLNHNAPIIVKPAGAEGGGGWGRRGIGRGFDIFQKNAAKFPTPEQKCKVEYN